MLGAYGQVTMSRAGSDELRPSAPGTGMRTGVAFAIASGLAFSVATVSANAGVSSGAKVEAIVLGRLSVGCLLLWVLVWTTDRTGRIAPRKRLVLASLGLISAGQTFCFYLSLHYISAAVAVLMLYAFPSIVAILAWLLRQERMTLTKVGGVVLSLLGVALIVGRPTGNLSLIGCILGLAAAAFLAVFIIAANRVAQDVSPVRATAWVLTGGTVAFIPIAAAQIAITQGPIGHWWWGILVGLAAGAGNTFFIASLHRITPTQASVASTIEPITTALLAAVFLGYVLTTLQGVGGALIVSALVLAAVSPARRGEPPPPVPAQSGTVLAAEPGE